jgi:hypothetical protein
MKRLLPIGIQDFAKIREGGYVYVDKTAHIHELLTGSGTAFFLSRPRRFGKSLLCSTLGAIFESRRELFGGIAGRSALAIDSLEWEWRKHPVIRIDLNAEVYSNGTRALHSALYSELQRTARKYSIELPNENAISQFKYIIERVCDKIGERAVVIIDEYDKPLLETIDDQETHNALRKELKGFYGVLKSSDEYLRFVFLTGVTKFSHVSIFSDLNHLVDLTLDPLYADICGITQDELESCFAPEIENAVKNTGKSPEEYLKEVRQFYNGYRFSKKEIKVYNPFGLLKHFNSGGDFGDYWYETGTPTFLIKLITDQKIDILNLTNKRIDHRHFSKFDIENMDAVVVLYQSGYLTISGYDEKDNSFALDYPNDEVRTAFATSLIEQYLQVPKDRSIALIVKLPSAIRKGEIENAVEALRSFLASIPNNIIENREKYFQTATHIVFTMLGLNCRSEVCTSDGRLDALVETKDFIYCFEFKIDKSADEAMEQIDKNDYLLPYKGCGKKQFKVGVNFDSGKRNIGEWKYEIIE